MLSWIAGAFASGYVPFALFFCLIIIIRQPNSFKKYVFVYALLFAMIAYCYEPTYEIDLSRYFDQLNYCRTIPFSEAFTWSNDGLLVKNVLFWLISRLGDNHILPLLSVGTVYGISAYICADSRDKTDCKLWVLLLFQITLFPYYSIQSNVRNVAAFALIILAVYRDLVYKKRDLLTVLLYILPCFLHMTGFVLVLIRFLLILIKKHPYIGLAITLGIPSASIMVFENIGAIELPGNIGAIIRRAIWKAYSSTVNSSEYAITQRESTYFNACRIVLFVVCVLLLMVLLSQLKDKLAKYYEFKLFCGVLLAITVIWIVLGTVKYWVFAFAAIASSAPILVDMKTGKNHLKKWKYQLFWSIIPVMMCARVVLEIYYISKRINILEYFDCLFTSNFWIVVVKAIANVCR